MELPKQTMYATYIVRRTQIYIEDEQGERLARAADDSGVTMSALIRLAIDSYLDRDDSAAARLERFRSAVAESAGSLPELPSGSDYVDALRGDYAERERELWGKRE